MGVKRTREERLARKREYYQEWRLRNPDKSRIATAEWRQRNPDKTRLISNTWKKQNPDKHAAINMKRKAAMLQRCPTWADLSMIETFYTEAARRTAETGVDHHVDHVVPLQGKTVSGLHVHNNLQILTGVENMSKGNRW